MAQQLGPEVERATAPFQLGQNSKGCPFSELRWGTQIVCLRCPETITFCFPEELRTFKVRGFCCHIVRRQLPPESGPP